MLEEEPRRSLFFVVVRLSLKFELQKPISRATLHRALKSQPRYIALRKRLRGLVKIRVRFQADRPHQIWHGDAKAVFTVTLVCGSLLPFRVLSLLDDCTCYVLAAPIVISESIPAAIGAFRHAAARWGLPDAFYADRGSCYDSDLFRQALALLGVRRIGTKARNPQAHGKIEAYHRSLERWFVSELKHQLVRDALHLQELLDAVIHTLYLPHYHCEIRTLPKQALQDRRSERPVSLERLHEVFLEERPRPVCPRTGTIGIGPLRFRLPSELQNKKTITVLIYPESPDRPLLRCHGGVVTPLSPALVRRAQPRPDPAHAPALDPERPAGSLTPLLEHYRGRLLPKAQPGFGLPEVYAALAQALGRPVPSDEQEASQIVAFLKASPFLPQAFHAALHRTLQELGPGRPLRLILQHLQARVLADCLHLPLQRTRAEMSRMLVQHLRSLPTRLLLWIDETQMISEDTLHEIRLLAEADLEGPPLFSVIRTALPELRERLLAPSLFPLWRRIAFKVTLSGLRREEVEPFLDHVQGERDRKAFTPEALNALFEHSRGIPAILRDHTAHCLARREDPKVPIGAEQVPQLLESSDTL